MSIRNLIGSRGAAGHPARLGAESMGRGFSFWPMAAMGHSQKWLCHEGDSRPAPWVTPRVHGPPASCAQENPFPEILQSDAYADWASLVLPIRSISFWMASLSRLA